MEELTCGELLLFGWSDDRSWLLLPISSAFIWFSTLNPSHLTTVGGLIRYLSLFMAKAYIGSMVKCHRVKTDSKYNCISFQFCYVYCISLKKMQYLIISTLSYCYIRIGYIEEVKRIKISYQMVSWLPVINAKMFSLGTAIRWVRLSWKAYQN